jgi:hypothetical protein
MSKTQSIDISVPTAFRAGDGLETSSAVTEALGALGGPPRGWTEALQRAREAEWNLFRATSTGLADDVMRLDGHLQELKGRWSEYLVEEIRRHTPLDRALEADNFIKPAALLDLELGIRNTTALLADAKALLLAVPEERERLAIRHARDARTRAYANRQTPTNDAEIAALLDLADAVRADAEAQAKEQAAAEELYRAVVAAHRAASRLLVRELVGQIHDHARTCRSVVGSQALRFAAFPAFAPKEIGRSFEKSVYLAGLVGRLGGEAPDVERVFESALGSDDFRTLAETFRVQTGRYLVGARRKDR